MQDDLYSTLKNSLTNLLNRTGLGLEFHSLKATDADIITIFNEKIVEIRSIKGIIDTRIVTNVVDVRDAKCIMELLKAISQLNGENSDAYNFYVKDLW
jgi:hypothetical protein